MKKLSIFFLCILFHFDGFSQTEMYNLESQNLHKNVRKVIQHYYSYDKNSGGFVKKSVDIKRYNEEGNLIETYYWYNSTYSDSSPTKKLYNYNSDGLLTGTKDISDTRGKYSTEYKYTYNRKGHLTKRESVYKDGSKYYAVYENDRKGRVTSKKDYNKSGKLTAEVSYSYRGGKKTETRTSFSSKDGSIVGTYTTVYEDGKKTSYKSNSKYGNSTTTYEYDREGNLKQSNYAGKKNTTSIYDYVYDKKDNWVKKHYRSGKYQYFYFREIYFDNGDVSGSTEFDKRFINKHGNFANVEVVELVKKKTKKKTTTNTDLTTNSNNMPSFRQKNWGYTFVNMKGKISDISGDVTATISNGSKLSKGAKVEFKVMINGADTKYLNFTVDEYAFEKSKKRHIWVLKNSKSKGTFAMFNNPLYLRKKNINAMLIMGSGDNQITFYLQ